MIVSLFKIKNIAPRNMIAFTLLTTFLINLYLSSATDVTYLHFPANTNPLQGLEQRISTENAAIASKRMLNMGDKLFNHHDFEDAYKVYQEALYIQQHNSENAEIQEVTKTLRAIASVKRAMGDFDGALDALADILDMQMESSPEDVSDTLFEIGTTMLDGQFYEDALAVFEDSINALKETTNNSARIAESLDYIGEAYLRMDKIDDAINAWSDSIVIWSQLGFSSQVADTMNSVGVALFRTGDFANAKLMYETAIAYYGEDSNIDEDSITNRISLSKKNLNLLNSIVTIDVNVEQCVANYHLHGQLNQTGTIEC